MAVGPERCLTTSASGVHPLTQVQLVVMEEDHYVGVLLELRRAVSLQPVCSAQPAWVAASHPQAPGRG